VVVINKIPNITARKAKIDKEDIKDILLMAHSFYKEFINEKEDNFDFEFVAQTARDIINGKDSVLFLIDNSKDSPIGMVFVYIAPAYYNPKVKVVEAHHLFLKKDYRKGSAVKVMYNAIRDWARNKKTFWHRDASKKNELRYKMYKGDEKCQLTQQP